MLADSDALGALTPEARYDADSEADVLADSRGLLTDSEMILLSDSEALLTLTQS